MVMNEASQITEVIQSFVTSVDARLQATINEFQALENTLASRIDHIDLRARLPANIRECLARNLGDALNPSSLPAVARNTLKEAASASGIKQRQLLFDIGHQALGRSSQGRRFFDGLWELFKRSRKLALSTRPHPEACECPSH
jgi:hypothetical protein